MLGIGEEAVKRALKYGEMAEVYIEREKTLEVEIQRDLIDFGKIESMTGIGIRILKEGRMGFAYTSDPGGVDAAVRMAARTLGSRILMKTSASLNPPHIPRLRESMTGPSVTLKLRTQWRWPVE